jgi:hypothetical protein
VTTIIGLGLLGKLVGDSVAVLPESRGHTGGETKSRANHTSMVETFLSKPDSSPPVDIEGLSKEEVETLCRVMSRLDNLLLHPLPSLIHVI